MGAQWGPKLILRTILCRELVPLSRASRVSCVAPIVRLPRTTIGTHCKISRCPQVLLHLWRGLASCTFATTLQISGTPRYRRRGAYWPTLNHQNRHNSHPQLCPLRTCHIRVFRSTCCFGWCFGIQHCKPGHSQLSV